MKIIITRGGNYIDDEFVVEGVYEADKYLVLEHKRLTDLYLELGRETRAVEAALRTARVTLDAVKYPKKRESWLKRLHKLEQEHKELRAKRGRTNRDRDEVERKIYETSTKLDIEEVNFGW